jgi:hypothetical protein
MSTDPPLHQAVSSKPRPSPADMLGGIPGTVLAILTALSGIVATFASYQESQANTKASYETLKVAVERNTETLATQARAQAETRLWVQDLSERLERRQANTEKAIARKVSKPSAKPPVVVTPVELAPPAPPPNPPAPKPAELPSFEALSK